MPVYRRLPMLALLLLAPAACSPDDPAAKPTPEPTTITLELERDESAAPNPIRLKAHVKNESAAGLQGLKVTVTATGGTASEIHDEGDGTYTAVITPDLGKGEAGEVDISVTVGDLSAKATAVVLPVVDKAWGQPERVPGLVNTEGTEDSVEVSPDGRWLIVGTYSPVDLLCCIAGTTLPGCAGEPASVTNLTCSASRGPYAAPDRPGMPGAGRIKSKTVIDHVAPSVGIVTPQTYALPPVAAYGFARMQDGSFGDPFVIDIEMDGFTYAPSGFSFAGNEGSSGAPLVFAFDPLHGPETGPDIMYVEAKLGATVSLGRYTFNGSDVIADPFLPKVLALDPIDQRQSNPAFGSGYLWFDSDAPGEKDILVAKPAGALPDTSFTKTTIAGLSEQGVDEYQPYLDAPSSRLYFAQNFKEIASASFSGADPSLIASFGAKEKALGLTELSDAPGEIAALGEPSVARSPEGEEWLYFEYYVRRDGHYDASVARVRRR